MSLQPRATRWRGRGYRPYGAPPPLTAEEAAQQAESEGLTLLKSEGSSSTGYRGVTGPHYRGMSLSRNSSDKSKPSQQRQEQRQEQVWRGGKNVYLGRFATPEEAALSIARSPEGREAAAAPPPLTAEEAVRQAGAEGLTLLRSERSSTGYKNVTFSSSSRVKLYQAQLWRGGKMVHLGMFVTPEEAALCYARTSAAQAAAPQPPPASSRKRKVNSDEQPPDVPADIVVILEGRFVE